MKKRVTIERIRVEAMRRAVCASVVLCTWCAPNVWAQNSSDLSVSVSPAQQGSTKRMAFAFQDIPVRALLQVLGETAGVNIVTDESVAGTITLNLKDATWQEALDVIVRTKNLRLEQSNGIIYVRGNNGFVNSDAYSTNGNPYPRAQNSRKFDQQILIEARIVEAEDSFSRSLGVKLGFNDKSRMGTTYVPDPANAGKFIQVPARTDSGVMFGGNTESLQSLSGQNSATGIGQIPSVANTMINFPAAASVSGADPAAFAMTLFNSGLTRFINLELTALETDGKGKMISNPRVVTGNNIKAVIEQGTEIPYKETSTLGATNTSFRKANLKLEVTPQIAPNGEVLLDVDVTKDSVGTYTADGYTINTKHVQTQVNIDNGGTLVIGGIYQEDNRKAVDKVPLLGDIPLLGNLFKTTTRATSKTELLIFLTPHILDSRGNILPTKIQKIGIDE
jgi:type IV pilus assembly protein PilQ